MIRLDGPLLARAWLTVAIAAGSEPKDPQTYKAITIEEYPNGCRLSASDRALVLHAWVPDLDNYYGGSAAPAISTLSDRTVIAGDLDGRARSMLGHLLALAGRIGDDAYTPGQVEVRLELDVKRPDAGPQHGFDGMDPVFAVLSSPDVEEVFVPLVDMEPFDWRRAVDSHRPCATSDVLYSAELLERIGKARKHAEGPVRLLLGGRGSPTRVVYTKSDPEVAGVFITARDDDAEEAQP